ncbi:MULTISPECIES: DUF3578 domain-containing protein [unclassified Breznakia]|uniref:MrcB family domain-containing protein n=1 Tax=unclassified Breznakia TaxID=2623764 RepID=UPI0024752A93|nr:MULTISPECIES: DUF3578 domain-containing protein [unclassified Breznakia]MDH6367989.1 hypothetical protein [Breznakia sp. PH1-1]MDH6405080.1 hypothetical protein [Breznakia sp. PF1-11]MDH6412792.1 hypothetical protein [Breznakia sp. PFB1-11]MDH6415155.1 hypothetical protein [Breznakia sp. PFB1-14]MDH6417466.1 hypothetical protein [Breznakia sp. PFB1-4]
MRELLEYVLLNYKEEKQKPLANSLFAAQFKSQAKQVLEKSNLIDTSKYKIAFSIGMGNWADVPWIAVMNKSITTSAQRGYYFVYLFSADMQEVYLSLNQGYHFYEKNYKLKVAKNKARTVANWWKNTLRTALNNFSYDSINLHSKQDKARGYEAAHICGKCYKLDELPDNKELLLDMQNMISVYEELAGYLVEKNFEGKNNEILTEVIIDELKTDGDKLYTAPKNDLNADDYKDLGCVDEVIANVATEMMMKKGEYPIEPQFSRKDNYNHHDVKAKRDYLVKADADLKIGIAGEFMVLDLERKRLEDLGIDTSTKLEHSSIVTHDGASYDIKSVDEHGNVKYIEVKTTRGDVCTPFYITDKEYNFLEQNRESYYLYRVYNFNPKKKTAEYIVLHDELPEMLNMKPISYQVTLKQKDE